MILVCLFNAIVVWNCEHHHHHHIHENNDDKKMNRKKNERTKNEKYTHNSRALQCCCFDVRMRRTFLSLIFAKEDKCENCRQMKERIVVHCCDSYVAAWQNMWKWFFDVYIFVARAEHTRSQWWSRDHTLFFFLHTLIPTHTHTRTHAVLCA